MSGSWGKLSNIVTALGSFVEANLSNIVIGLMVVLAAAGAWRADPTVEAINASRCTPKQPTSATAPEVIQVSDASGEAGAIDVLIGRGGAQQTRRAGALPIESGGSLPMDTVLRTTTTDVLREDGLVLPEEQVSSWAVVNKDSTHVVIAVCVDPRYRQVSDPGRYSGAVTLDDPRVRGGNVPLTVHVQYPFLSRVLFWSLLAAVAGLTWTWLIRHADSQITAEPDAEKAPRNLAIRLASLGAAVPVVVAQVATNPDWRGDLAQYVTLGTLVGGAVIAAAPTLRALASRIKD